MAEMHPEYKANLERALEILFEFSPESRQRITPFRKALEEGKRNAELLYQKGEIGPLCAFVEEKLFTVFKNRDYRWMNEFAVKMAFVALLYNDLLYMIDSEPEVGRQYADLVMIIRPDTRHFEILDILVEFKYVGLQDAGLTGQKARELGEESVRGIPEVQRELQAAKAQVLRYQDLLEKKYGKKIRLCAFAVVSLGFERLFWEAL
jgi:hypothetical protein